MNYNLELLKELGLKGLKRKKILLIIFGIISMIAGLLCFSNPISSSEIVSIIVGWLLIFGGIFFLIGRIVYVKLYSFWSTLLGIILGLLYIYLGYQFIKNPEIGIISLAYLIGIGFLVVGIIRLIIGFSSVSGTLKILSIFTAVIELILGIFLIASWPENSILLLSVFLGVEFICNSVDSFIASGYLNNLIKNRN